MLRNTTMPHMASQTFHFQTFHCKLPFKGLSLIFLGNTVPVQDIAPELTRNCVTQLISHIQIHTSKQMSQPSNECYVINWARG